MNFVKKLSFIALITLPLLLTSCAEKEATIEKVNIEEYTSYIKEARTGFIVITNVGYTPDVNADMYLKTLKQVLDSEKERAIQYDVYVSDGENVNTGKDKHQNPYSDIRTENLYYIYNGKIEGEFDLTSLTGIRLKEELHEFIRLMNTR